MIRSGKAADLVLVGSERGRENLRATQGIERPIKVLFPLQEPPSAMDVGDRNVGSGLIRIGYFGRLEPAKGIDALLNIWKRLRIGRTVLNLHGPDPEGSYQRLVHRMGLSEQVEVKGPYVQADLQMLLAETDLAVLPSLNEGNPIVIQEFMSNGVPFVMTDVGAGPELTRGCEDARLATLSDLGVIEALEEMVTRLRNGDLSRSRLRAYYERNFAYAKTRRSYLNLFREIESHIHTRE